MKFKERVIKLVIKPGEIDGQDNFALNLNENTVTCMDCGSHLFYIKKELGVVAEEGIFGILGNRDNRTYQLREIGLALYCAECGTFEESYQRFSYEKDQVVCNWDELNGSEVAEIEYCLIQWDQKGDFKPRYKCTEVNTLKEKLKEYEKKFPIKLKGGKKR